MNRTRSLLALAALVLLITAVPCLAQPPLGGATPPVAKGPVPPDKGDTAWMLISSALVLLMVPGLALFYGGMVRRKNILATMMQSMVALAIVGVFWIAVGYSLAFGEPLGTPGESFLGWSDKLFFLKGVESTDLLPGTGIPIYLHVMFQGMFAIITPALISGAIAERIRFGPYCAFILAWVTFVYCPLAHMVWAQDWWVVTSAKGPGAVPVGWLGGAIGALDFAGGTVVHIAAGFSALAAILVLRKRLGYPEHSMHPSSMVLTLAGAGLLWFGWFGFNGGSATASGALAVSAFSASQAAAAAAGLSWMIAEWIHRGKPTALGLASGIVAGLVAVTPASGYVKMHAGLIIGAIAGLVCYGAVFLKRLFKYDDSLDAFGVHGVGGFLGAVLTGLFCTSLVNKDAVSNEGLLVGGGSAQVIAQLIAAAVSAAGAFVISLILVKLIDIAFTFTTDAESEITGLDHSEHGETGFDMGPAVDTMAAFSEPKPAQVPPNGGKRFKVVVDGIPSPKLVDVWSELCQPSSSGSAEFQAVYPYVTTVQGNTFRFRGGDPEKVRSNLERLLAARSNGYTVRVRVEA